MNRDEQPMPTRCPACTSELYITRLQCPSCGTEVGGAYRLDRLARLPEPHASLIELFLLRRGNMKEMERDLGISYPTVRARLEEALKAAGLERAEGRQAAEKERQRRRHEILDELERGAITAQDAAEQLRELKPRR